MKRGTSRAYIKTRSGVSEVRIERRAIPAPRAPEPVLVPVIALDDTWQPLGLLAENIARALKDRGSFPPEFYKGAVE